MQIPAKSQASEDGNGPLSWYQSGGLSEDALPDHYQLEVFLQAKVQLDTAPVDGDIDPSEVPDDWHPWGEEEEKLYRKRLADEFNHVFRFFPSMMKFYNEFAVPLAEEISGSARATVGSTSPRHSESEFVENPFAADASVPPSNGTFGVEVSGEDSFPREELVKLGLLPERAAEPQSTDSEASDDKKKKWPEPRNVRPGVRTEYPEPLHSILIEMNNEYHGGPEEYWWYLENPEPYCPSDEGSVASDQSRYSRTGSLHVGRPTTRDGSFQSETIEKAAENSGGPSSQVEDKPVKTVLDEHENKSNMEPATVSEGSVSVQKGQMKEPKANKPGFLEWDVTLPFPALAHQDPKTKLPDNLTVGGRLVKVMYMIDYLEERKESEMRELAAESSAAAPEPKPLASNPVDQTVHMANLEQEREEERKEAKRSWWSRIRRRHSRKDRR